MTEPRRDDDQQIEQEPSAGASNPDTEQCESETENKRSDPGGAETK